MYTQWARAAMSTTTPYYHRHQNSQSKLIRYMSKCLYAVPFTAMMESYTLDSAAARADVRSLTREQTIQ